MDEKVYYYCTPVQLMDGDVTWYMLTIVPVAVLESRVEPVRNHLYLMVLVVTICIFLGILFFFFVARQQQKTILRYAYEDPLTLGPNYAKFCLEMQKKRSRSGYMVTMDIMNFNNINIVAGKNAGDIAIGQIWNIIQDKLQYDELAGHVREDVYVLFLRGHDKDILVGRLNDISSAINKIAIKGDRNEPIIAAIQNIEINHPELYKELSKVIDVELWDGYSLMIHEEIE